MGGQHPPPGSPPGRGGGVTTPHLGDDGVSEDAIAVGPTVAARLGGRPGGCGVDRAVDLQEVPLGFHETATALGTPVTVGGDRDVERDVPGADVGHRPRPAVVLGDPGGEVLQQVVAGQHQQRNGQGDHVGHLEAAHPTQEVQQLHERHGGTRDGSGAGPGQLEGGRRRRG